MSKTVLYMSMSVDGFIAGPSEGPGNGLGDGRHRLHEWFLPWGSVGARWISRSAVSWSPAATRAAGVIWPGRGPRRGSPDVVGCD